MNVDTNNYAAILYLRINPVSGEVARKTIANIGVKDYAYPAIASFGRGTWDKSVAIGFLATSSTTYPEMRVKIFDNAMRSDSSIIIKTGIGLPSSCYDNGKFLIRWGDYSGMCRLYGQKQPPTVWMSGCYGLTSGFWGTHIAQVNATSTGVDGVNNINKKLTSVKISPNPVSERFNVHFVATENTWADFLLYNTNGQLVANLYQSRLSVGENQFSFERNNLNAGVYILKIITDKNQTIANEKIVVIK
jgi:hypothetical protein